MPRSLGTNRILVDHGAWIEVEVSTRKHPAAVLKIDRDDWDIFSGEGYGRWSAVRDYNRLYAAAGTTPLGPVRMHRLILPGVKIVDHINRDGLDNRRCNLRPASPALNAYNQSLSHRNKSGVAGVLWVPRLNQWQVTCCSKYIGIYRKFEDAVKARWMAEAEVQHA